MKRIFLVDGNSLLYRAFHATPYLSSSKGVPTNATYAFTNMLKKLLNDQKPDGLLVIFDSKVPSFREEIFKEYKATRPPMPSNMPVQIPYVKEIIRAMGIHSVEKEGFEADDVIGTMVARLRDQDAEIYLVTSDKDMMQFVSKNVFVVDTMKNVVMGESEVTEKFGVKPSLIADFLALCGDTSDNIPGVLGIGDKTARELVSTFGTIDDIYANLESIKKEAVKAKLREGRDNALMSKELATIRLDVPLDITDEDLEIKDPDTAALKRVFRELELTGFLRELKTDVKGAREWSRKTLPELLQGPFSLALQRGGKGAYEVHVEAFAVSDGVGAYFSREEKELLEYLGAAHGCIVHDLKPLLVMLKRKGRAPGGGYFDTMLASYLINPLRKEYGIDGLLEEFLDISLAGAGPEEMLPQRALLLHELKGFLAQKMDETGLAKLFSDVEMPLVEVIAGMEFYGVRIDRQKLMGLSVDFDKRLTTIMKTIYELAGETFNINSPQQLGRVLFEKLQLPPLKKTKTSYSTDIEVLQFLADQHPLPKEVLEYRSLSKLKNTYIDVLPSLIHRETGRIHASFNQMVVATGRLSSSDPNLQNIPIRGEEGRKIREAFIAEDGCLLLSADYSQIELRVLAHMSGDELLLDAFRRDEDIHARVAREVFRVAPELVTQEMRRTAKVINFGVVYGISGFGLAKELGVSPKEAQAYIDDYFARHTGVQAYIDATLQFVRENGYVKTLLGRMRRIPEIHNPDVNVRQFGERTAVNTPLQGTAADIIKLAMVNIYRRIEGERRAARLIMQIHDELVFEVPEAEVPSMEAMVRQEMEHVLELAVPLKVSVGRGKNWAEAHD